MLLPIPASIWLLTALNDARVRGGVLDRRMTYLHDTACLQSSCYV